MRGAGLLSVALLGLAAGCHGSAPIRDVPPPLYNGWSTLPPRLSHDLETARTKVGKKQLDNADDTLLSYARLSTSASELLAEQWLQLTHHRDGAPDSETALEQQARARQRVVESARYTLGLYQQHELQGGMVMWKDRVHMAWLLILVGEDVDARETLSSALATPDLPGSARTRIEKILANLGKLPPEEKP